MPIRQSAGHARCTGAHTSAVYLFKNSASGSRYGLHSLVGWWWLVIVCSTFSSSIVSTTSPGRSCPMQAPQLSRFFARRPEDEKRRLLHAIFFPLILLVCACKRYSTKQNLLQGAHPRFQELGGLRRQQAEQCKGCRSDVGLLSRLPGVRRCQQLVWFQPLSQVVYQLLACQENAKLVDKCTLLYACIQAALIITGNKAKRKGKMAEAHRV